MSNRIDPMGFRDDDPPRWRRVADSVRTRIKQENISLTSAGLAFYAFLALVPALIAVAGRVHHGFTLRHWEPCGSLGRSLRPLRAGTLTCDLPLRPRSIPP